jgi:hypothetical protein
MNLQRTVLRARRLALAVLTVLPALAGERIGAIEFYGYKGMDIAALRRTLPVREGDAYSGRTKDLIRKAVAASIGREPTDVAAICCDEQHNRLLFIGLPGGSYQRPMAFLKSL